MSLTKDEHIRFCNLADLTQNEPQAEYLCRLSAHVSPHPFTRDAIEWAAISGLLTFSGNLQDDLAALMPQYDALVEAYQRHSRELEAALYASYAPLLAELNHAPTTLEHEPLLTAHP